MEDISKEIEAIWEKDLLGRRQDAEYLGSYLSKRFALKPDEPGFVLAVDGEWGFGKSFMIQRWQKQFALQDYPTVFFNAWENDYTDDPLLAFIAELNAGLEEFFDHVPTIKGVEKNIRAKLRNAFIPVMKAAGLAITKKALGIGFDEIKEMLSESSDHEQEDRLKLGGEDVKAISEKMQAAFEKALDSHKTKKAAIVEFKANLRFLIEALQNVKQIQLPLFVFVDELDRCRPDYAIELLEGIKHLFGVPGVYFVVATNTIQLGESIRAVYGNGFDGQRYLKRFFDLQFSLPEPSNEEFLRALFAEMTLPEEGQFVHGLNPLYGIEMMQGPERDSVKLLVYVLSLHSSAFGIGLRDLKQIANMLEAAFVSLKARKIHIFFLVFLAVVYHQNLSAFNRLSKYGNQDDEIFDRLRAATDQKRVRYEYYGNQSPDPELRAVGVLEIANTYLGNLSVPVDQRSRLKASRDDFPRSLLDGVAGEEIDNVFRPAFSAYFDVIRQAGGFSNR